MRTIEELPYVPSDYIETWDNRIVQRINGIMATISDRDYTEVCRVIEDECQCVGDAIEYVLDIEL